MQNITFESKLTKSQKTTRTKLINYCGKQARMIVELRYDDECGNGHNTFAITADIYSTDKRVNPRENGWLSGGCQHEEIEKHFPELASFIKWHLCSSDGPMHYVQNTVFLAGDRDCWGHRKGEPCRFRTHIQFDKNPIKHNFDRHESFVQFLQEDRSGFDFEVIRIDHERDRDTFGPKYTFGGYAAKWHECPFDSEQEALDFLTALQTCEPKFVRVATDWGKGKDRELDAARHAAIWPEATDEELTSPDLKERLEARLPQLLADFRTAMESLGFIW